MEPSLRQPGLGDWPSHPILKRKAGVSSTSHLQGLHQTHRSASLSLLSQEPRGFLQLEVAGRMLWRRGCRVLVFL